MKRWKTLSGLLVGLLLVGGSQAARASLVSSLILDADLSYVEQDTKTQLFDTGEFSTLDVRNINDQAGLPTLAQLKAYNSVLVYTNYAPSDPTRLGNLLADYVDQGGHVTLATYGFTPGAEIGGRIATHGYSPFSSLGSTGDVSGKLVPVLPGDRIFSGVDTDAMIYYHNDNFANPGLDAGATLLATDGAGTNMIARNANNSVIDLNLYPGYNAGDAPVDNAQTYRLIANSMQVDTAPVPEPSTWAMGILMLVGLGLVARRKKQDESAPLAALTA